MSDDDIKNSKMVDYMLFCSIVLDPKDAFNIKRLNDSHQQKPLHGVRTKKSTSKNSHNSSIHLNQSKSQDRNDDGFTITGSSLRRSTLSSSIGRKPSPKTRFGSTQFNTGRNSNVDGTYGRYSPNRPPSSSKIGRSPKKSPTRRLLMDVDEGEDEALHDTINSLLKDRRKTSEMNHIAKTTGLSSRKQSVFKNVTTPGRMTSARNNNTIDRNSKRHSRGFMF